MTYNWLKCGTTSRLTHDQMQTAVRQDAGGGVRYVIPCRPLVLTCQLSNGVCPETSHDLLDVSRVAQSSELIS